MSNNKFKSSMGQWYTRSLFYEEYVLIQIASRPPIEPLFTLYQERPGLVCFRTSFVKLNDPTGYKWAIKYLGDFEHWKALMKCKWFIDAYENACSELKMKIRADALSNIKEIAEGDNPNQALVANKYLASFEWEKNEKRGRPTKQELSGELKRQAALLTEEDMDAQRIGLKLKEIG